MREKLRYRIDSSHVATAMRRYYDSVWYLVTIGVMTLFGFATGLDLVTMLLTAAIGCIGMVVAFDLRPALLPTLVVVFQMSPAHSPQRLPWMTPEMQPDGAFFRGGAPFVLVVVALVVISLVFFFHTWLRGTLRTMLTRPTHLLFWSLPLVAALMLNGIFREGYTVKNLLFGLGTAALWVVIYLVYYHGLSHGEETFFYGAKCCFTALLVLLAEFFVAYMTSWEMVFADHAINKFSLFFGWGISNNFGAMVALLTPVCFYMAAYQRHGWIYWIAGAVSWVAVIFSYSRTALLVGTGIAFLSALLVCFVGRYKKLYRILLGASTGAILLALVIVLLASPETLTTYNRYIVRSFNDSGRFALWRDGLACFKEAPIFGVGFWDVPIESWSGIGIPGFLHNTPIQMLAACGLFGLIAYLVMRARSVWLFVSRPSLNRLFLGLALAALLAESLLDNHIFNIYPSFYYALFLALAEHDYERSLEKEKQLNIQSGDRNT